MNATFEKRLQRKPVKARLGKTLNNQQSPRADLRQKLASKKRTVDARSVLRNRRPRALFTRKQAKVVIRKAAQNTGARKPGGRTFLPRKATLSGALQNRATARVGVRQRRQIRRYAVSRIPDLLTLPMVSPAFLPTSDARALFGTSANQPATVVSPPTTGTRLSPIQGFRVGVRNLQPTVSLDDVYELFSSVGTLRMCNLIRPGQAEVVYNELVDAEEAVRRYHNRELDGRPMNISLLTHVPNELSGSSRLASRLGPRVERSWQSEQAVPKALTTSTFSGKNKQSAEIDVDIVRKALFNVSTGAGTSSRRPVDFNVSLR